MRIDPMDRIDASAPFHGISSRVVACTGATADWTDKAGSTSALHRLTRGCGHSDSPGVPGVIACLVTQHSRPYLLYRRTIIGRICTEVHHKGTFDTVNEARLIRIHLKVDPGAGRCKERELLLAPLLGGQRQHTLDQVLVLLIRRITRSEILQANLSLPRNTYHCFPDAV